MLLIFSRCFSVIRCVIPNTGFVKWDDSHIRFKWFQAIKKEDVVGKKVTVRFRPWSRDIDHTMKLKDADHMGSATKVIVLASDES